MQKGCEGLGKPQALRWAGPWAMGPVRVLVRVAFASVVMRVAYPWSVYMMMKTMMKKKMMMMSSLPAPLHQYNQGSCPNHAGLPLPYPE